MPNTTAKRLEQDGDGLAGFELELAGALGGDDGADGGAFVEVTGTSASISPSWTLCTLPEKWLQALVGASPVLDHPKEP